MNNGFLVIFCVYTIPILGLAILGMIKFGRWKLLTLGVALLLYIGLIASEVTYTAPTTQLKIIGNFLLVFLSVLTGSIISTALNEIRSIDMSRPNASKVSKQA